LAAIGQKSLKLPEGRKSIKIKSFQDGDKNSFVIEVFDLGERSMRKDCMVDLMTTIFEEPVFDTLRTKEQLAYTVRIDSDTTDDSIIMMLYIKSQEDKHPARSIAARLLNFVMADMKDILEKLSDEDYGKISESMINSQLIPFTDFDEESQFYWNQIVGHYYAFDRKQKKAEMYAKISKQDVINFYNEMFVDKPRRNLNIQLIGSVTGAEDDDNNDDMSLTLIDSKFDDEDEVITDLEEFKRGLEHYPSFKTTYHYD
jgi:secreted Zn-dependent insulinase-like peptidase